MCITIMKALNKIIINRFSKFFGMDSSVTTVIVLVTLLLGLFSACFTLTVQAPMTGLDEQSHYGRSIQIASGQIIVPLHGDMSQVGGYISTSQREFIHRGSNTKQNINKSYKSVSTKWYQGNKDLPYTDKKIFYPCTNAVPYTPFSYLPYIIVAKICQIFRVAPLNEYIAMKIVGFTCYFLVMILAIKITPIGKLVLAILLTIPTVTVTFTTISADGYLIAISSLFFAVILSLKKTLQEQKYLSNNQILAVASVSILLGMAKIPIFIFMSLLIPIIWTLFYRDGIARKQSYLMMLVFIFTVIVTLYWIFLVKDVNTGAFLGRNVNTFEQLKFIRSDVSGFVKLLFTTIAKYSFFIYQIAYTNDPNITSIPKIVGYVIPVTLIIAVFIEGNSVKITSPKHNFLSFEMIKILSIIGYILCVFIILYLQFVPIGSDFIEGVQQRYFIPIYFITLSFIPKRLKMKGKSTLLIFIPLIIPILSYIKLLMTQLS